MDYKLSVGGPRPFERHIYAEDDNGAVAMMRHELEAMFPGPLTEDEAAATIALTCDADGTNYTGTVGQAFPDRVPRRPA